MRPTCFKFNYTQKKVGNVDKVLCSTEHFVQTQIQAIKFIFNCKKLFKCKFSPNVIFCEVFHLEYHVLVCCRVIYDLCV